MLLLRRWRPIRSAPRDGRLILVKDTYGTRYIVACVNGYDRWETPPTPYRVEGYVVVPVLWMHLPR